jgi:hypothetical protein
VSIIAPLPQQVGYNGEENQSDTTSDMSEIFSDNGSDSVSSSDPELDSEVLNSEDEPDDNTFDDEG